jgi:[ribosomal protein S5]-alanine N-acetyltransferase
MILPELETQRLCLRPINSSDVEFIFALRSNKNLMRYIPRKPCNTLHDAELLTAEMILAIENNTKFNWVAIHTEDKIKIGLMGYYRIYLEHKRAEVGYMLSEEYHNKGLMQEALQALLEFGFTQLGLHSIEAIIDPENIASETVLHKAGFIKEAHFKQNILFEGRFLDSVHYALFNPND